MTQTDSLCLNAIGSSISFGSAELSILGDNCLVRAKNKEHVIPISAIRGVELSPPKFLTRGTLTLKAVGQNSGYIQVAGVLAGVGQDMQFVYTQDEHENAEKIKDYVLSRLMESAQPSQLSIADELIKLKGLLDSGAVTQEEYQVLKSKLI